jgi:hypothetical protein
VRVGEGGRSLLDGVMEKELKEGEEVEISEMRDEVMNFLIAVSWLNPASPRMDESKS